jgi:hypothetical protein
MRWHVRQVQTPITCSIASNWLKKELSNMFGHRGSDRMRKPSDKRNLVMIKSRLCDIYIAMLPPDKKSKHPSLTRKKGKEPGGITAGIGKLIELI